MAEPVKLQPFGDYVLIERVASGGMADVFCARVVGIRGFTKTVAIKRIHAHLAEGRQFTTMFTDEAKIASRLTHPNIVQILELGEVEDRPFIAMEFVPGQDLYHVQERLKALKERCPWPMAIRISLDLARALHHAHEFRSPDGRPQCIIHRDVSPRNVLISYTGDVKLTDFGIARALDREEHTRHGQIKGKVRYMAPEVALGREFDHRTDIFALGIVLAELLTMEPYRDGPDEMSILLAIRDGRERDVFGELPLDLGYIVQRALHRDPDRRYASAEDFRADLASIATGSLAPMTTLELGHFTSGLFAEEAADARRLQVEVDRALASRDRGRPKTVAESVSQSVPKRSGSPSHEGSLGDTSLTRLLGDLHRYHWTGRLDLRRAPLEKSVYFTGGEPVYVTSNVEKEAFGEYLVMAGLLTPSDFQRVRKQTEQGSLQLIDVLLRSKAVTPNELYKSLSDQVRDRILDLFTWSDGTFAFYRDERPPDAATPLNLHCLTLVQEGVMERLPLAVIRRALSDAATVVLRRSIFTVPPRLGLSGRDLRLLHRIETDPCTLQDLLEGEGGEEKTLRLIYLLRELGLVEIGVSGVG